MVKQCVICKKHFYMSSLQSSTKLSFHMLPQDQHRRNKWISALGLNPDIPKYTYICSDHFNPEDFVETDSGRIFLTINAVPQLSSSSYIFQSRNSLVDSGIDRQAAEIHTVTSSRIPLRTLCVTSPLEKVFPEESDLSSSPGKSAHGSSTVTASQSPSSTLTADSLSLNNDQEFNFSDQENILQRIEKISCKRKRKLNPRFFGDCSTSDMDNPKRARRNWSIAKKTVIVQRRKIATLAQRSRRLKTKVTSLNLLAEHLRERNLISENADAALKVALPTRASQEIFSRLLNGPSKAKYSPELRAFALTLNFYSGPAYEYVRETFNNILPHPKTIARWYQCVDGRPGLSQEAFSAIKCKVDEERLKNKPVLCNLIMDEIAIKKHVEWSGKEFVGYVDIGANINTDLLDEAREALFFMLVAINDHWKVPIAYFLINGLTASEKANVVKKVLEFIHDTGVIVPSFTFDGTILAKCNVTPPYSG